MDANEIDENEIEYNKIVYSSDDDGTTVNTNTTTTTRKRNAKPKEVFEEICEHCSKILKKKDKYLSHTVQQVCYSKNEITYCKICDITLENRKQYEKHMISKEHMLNIGCDSLEKMNIQDANPINTRDPYLDSNEINKLNKKNLGNSFTFVYKTGNTQTISLVNNQKPPTPTNTNTNTNTSIPNRNISRSNSSQPNSNVTSTDASPRTSPKNNESSINLRPSARQIKIITFLEKQTSLEESGINFYRMLDNKLQLEDYKGLQTFIKQMNINNDFKMNYLKTIEQFIGFLVKQRNNGINVYKDKQISELVINLTS
jgi:hypothetical protein